MDNNERAIIMSMVRAEAEAQAKIYAKQVAEQFNAIHNKDAERYIVMADAINTLSAQAHARDIKIKVLKDLIIDPKPLLSEGLAVNRIAKFKALCDQKQAEFEKGKK